MTSPENKIDVDAVSLVLERIENVARLSSGEAPAISDLLDVVLRDARASLGL